MIEKKIFVSQESKAKSFDCSIFISANFIKCTVQNSNSYFK